MYPILILAKINGLATERELIHIEVMKLKDAIDMIKREPVNITLKTALLELSLIFKNN